MANLTKKYAFTKVAGQSVHHAWPKAAGPVISEALLDAAATLISRHGTAKHLALAMYLRPEGATQPEVIMATGDTGNNAFTTARDLSKCGTPAVEGRNGHKAYALALPAKRKATNTRKGAGKGKADATPKAGTDQA